MMLNVYDEQNSQLAMSFSVSVYGLIKETLKNK